MAVWNEVIVSVPSGDLEKAESIVTAVASGGLYIEDYSDMLSVLPSTGHYDYISETLLDKDRTRSDIHLYLNEDEAPSDVIAFIEQRCHEEHISCGILMRTVSDSDWEEGWKQYFHVRRIGQRIIICPSWEEYNPEGNEAVVMLDPGMSFGTGDHESTQLSLILLEKCHLCGKKILDIGTGSGILGIAALKLGAENVLAVDIDVIAVKVSRENAEINAVGDRFEVLCENITDEMFAVALPDNFDLITANVVADFHIANLPLYSMKLRTKGLIITSGIIKGQLKEVERAVADNGFRLCETVCLNDWCAILAEKL